MTQMNLTYQGQLHCHAEHVASGATLTTDAPLDNGGKGESFSPTDLVATALAVCVLTMMAKKAEKAYRTKWRLKNAVSLMLQGFKRGQRL